MPRLQPQLDPAQARPLVERFAEIDGWTVARKTALLSGSGAALQLVSGTVLVLCMNAWGGVHTGRLALVMVAGVAVQLAICGASLMTYRAGREGLWTAYLMILGSGIWISAFVQSMGSWSTPFFSYYPLAVLMVALYYGERIGWAAFGLGAAMLAVREVLEASGLIGYAFVLRDRTIDSQHHTAFVAGSAFVVMSLFLFCFVVSTLVVATRRLQDRRLRRAHLQLAVSKDQIQRSNELIARYAPREVSERILSGEFAPDARPERLKLTIVFTDVVGFTDSSDEMDPEALTDFLNDYLARMSEIAERHGASINQFVGDGLMIFFGAPRATDDRDNAVRAVRMALEMQESMPSLNETWLQRGGRRPFEVRIGINTGYASVGDYGSPGRKTYSAIGIQVNVAARIEGECRPGKVLVSDTTWVLARDEFLGTDRGEIVLRGLHYPVRVYEVEPAVDPAAEPVKVIP